LRKLLIGKEDPLHKEALQAFEDDVTKINQPRESGLDPS
jgi:hypothetical protein